MSYSSNRRDALDPDQPLAHRASHARSCAMLVAQKWRLPRGEILEAVRKECGVDLEAVTGESEIDVAIIVLDGLRQRGLAKES